MKAIPQQKKYFRQGVFIVLFGGIFAMVLLNMVAKNDTSLVLLVAVAILTYFILMCLLWQRGRSSRHRLAISVMMFLSLGGGIGLQMSEELGSSMPPWFLSLLSVMFLLNFLGICLLYSLRHFHKNHRPWQAYLKWLTLMILMGVILFVVASAMYRAFTGTASVTGPEESIWLGVIAGVSPLVFVLAHLSELWREAKHPSYQKPYQDLIDQIDVPPEPSEGSIG
ncbi:MAG: hypothetical protein AAF804_14590 [Bacteroidota bacterium]